MGTRSITVFEDEDGEEIARLYRQMDGYPEGHGLDMAHFLEGNQIVNGYGMSGEDIFNYNGCTHLASLLPLAPPSSRPKRPQLPLQCYYSSVHPNFATNSAGLPSKSVAF